MSDGSVIVKQRQLAIRREMDRRGFALKVLSLDTVIPQLQAIVDEADSIRGAA